MIADKSAMILAQGEHIPPPPLRQAGRQAPLRIAPLCWGERGCWRNYPPIPRAPAVSLFEEIDEPHGAHGVIEPALAPRFAHDDVRDNPRGRGVGVRVLYVRVVEVAEESERDGVLCGLCVLGWESGNERRSGRPGSTRQAEAWAGAS